MTNPDDFSAGSREWMTLIGDDIKIFLSDGSEIFVRLTDTGWVITHDGIIINNDGDLLPYRAGAMEFVRKYIRSLKLETVPSEAQKAAPWYDHRPGGPKDGQRRDNNGLTLIEPGTVRSAPKPVAVLPDGSLVTAPPAFDALAFARELDAMRIAAELDALMKGAGDA